jgi:cytochrome c oxidase assembly protein subunit 15
MSPLASSRSQALWLFSVSALIALLIVFGGWVRLTRSGLSITEWNVVTGVVPPLHRAAWEEEFARYRQTPEYRHVNYGMSLEEFKFIYWMEYGHRLLGRVAGLAFVVPFLFFLARGVIPRRRCLAYLGIGLLFALQGLIGWLMVKSGLLDRPSVSHVRLTLHLGAAFLLLLACLWLALDHLFPTQTPSGTVPLSIRRLCLAFLVAVFIQSLAGGLMAGLKAGYLSDTFPRMFGQWVPEGLWRLQPLASNFLDNPALVHFQHRWFAFAVLGLALLLVDRSRSEHLPPPWRNGARWALALVVFQVGLGIGAVLLHLPLALASLHQAMAVVLLGLALFLCHRACRA